MNHRNAQTAAILFAACLFQAAAEGQTISVIFSPTGKPVTAATRLFDAAKKSIDLTAYSLTHRQLSLVLIAAHKRGVHVRIIVDKSQEHTGPTTARWLSANGIPLRTDDRHKIAHNKYAVIDGQTTLTGSANWTDSADGSNAENQLTIHDTRIAAAFTADFETHWAHARLFRATPPPPRLSPTNPPRSRFSSTNFAQVERFLPWHWLLVRSILTTPAVVSRAASFSPTGKGEKPSAVSSRR